MPLIEAIEGITPPKKIVRIDQMFPEWSPGEIYTGQVALKLLSMDQSGMMMELVKVDFDETQSKNEGSERIPMQVSPSPSA